MSLFRKITWVKSALLLLLILLTGFGKVTAGMDLVRQIQSLPDSGQYLTDRVMIHEMHWLPNHIPYPSNRWPGYPSSAMHRPGNEPEILHAPQW